MAPDGSTPRLAAALDEAERDTARPIAHRLETLAAIIAEDFDVERCFITRLEGGHLRTVAGIDMGAADPRYDPLPITRGVLGRVARTRHTARVDDVRRDPDYVAALALTRSELAAAIVRGDRVLGVLNLESNRLAAFAPDAERRVEGVAARLAAMPDFPV